MTGLAAFRSRFSWLDRWTLGVLVLWVAWAAVAAARAGVWLVPTSPYVVAPLMVVLGVLVGERAARQVDSRVLAGVVLVLALLFLVGVLTTAAPGKRPLGYANANAAFALQLVALAGLALVGLGRVGPGRVGPGRVGPGRVRADQRTRADRRRADQRTRQLAWGGIGVALLVVVANRSVGAMAVAGPLCLAVLWSHLRLRRRWPYPVTALLAAAAAAAAVFQLAATPVWPTPLLRALDSARQSLWQDALAAWASAPVAGVGPGILHTMTRLGGDPDTAPVHSLLLQVGAETGWIGVGLLVALVVTALLWASRGSARGAVIGCASIAALLVHSQMDHLVDFWPVSLAAGLVIGLAGCRSFGQ